MKQSGKLALAGVVVGLLSGFFGAAGGVVAVAAQKLIHGDTKLSHAGAVAVILPVSVVSAVVYFLKNPGLDWSMLWYIVPATALGGFLGSRLFKKVSEKWLTRAYVAFAIFAAARMLFW